MKKFSSMTDTMMTKIGNGAVRFSNASSTFIGKHRLAASVFHTLVALWLALLIVLGMTDTDSSAPGAPLIAVYVCGILLYGFFGAHNAVQFMKARRTAQAKYFDRDA